MGHGVGGKVGIQRHRDMPGHPDRQVGDDPVRAVFRDQGNVRALGQFTGAQPMGSATCLMADLAPGEGLHLAATNGLDQEALARMARLTFKEDLQRQTKSDRHGTRSCVFRWQPTKHLLG